MRSAPPLLMIMLMVIVMSCRPIQVSSTYGPAERSVDSLSVTVTCINLSEDMTKNDEVLIIAYVHKDSSSLESPLFYERMNIDVNSMTKEFQWKLNTDIAGKDIVLFLIEQDEELPVQQIDSVLRIHYRDMISAYNKRDYSAIEKYLGDEDILGVKFIPRMDYSTPYSIPFTGMQKLDKYDYRIRIDNYDTNMAK